MASHPLRSALLVLAASVGLAGCSTYGDYGYGYSGVSVGYGTAYSYPSYGWYDDYYYPGTGYYVYNRAGQRYRWNDNQRRYWEARRDRREVRDNRAEYRQDRRADRREYRQERREDRRAVRSGAISRPAYRADRQADRREYRQERREDRRELRRENRCDRRN